MTEIEKNKKLCEEYPFILPRNAWTGVIDPDYDYSYTVWDQGPGWSKAFGDIYLEELGDELDRLGITNHFQIIQVKEKYGSLRVYTNGAPQPVYDIIDKFEAISEHVCYECGALDVPIIDDFGWYQPLCEECYNKHVQSLSERYGKDFKWNPPTYKTRIEQGYNENERDFTIPESVTYMGSRPTSDGGYESYQRVIPFGDTVKKIRAKAALKEEKAHE